MYLINVSQPYLHLLPRSLRFRTGLRVGGLSTRQGHGMEILKFLWEPGNIERLREGLQHVATLTKVGRKQLLDTIFHDLESGLALRDPEIDRPFYPSNTLSN